ncbi:MAG: hypothetical protein ABR525_10040, partial [Candidatus Limnocylindria bacterium]
VIPGTTPIGSFVESIVGTLQFYRPMPPPVAPIVSRAEAVADTIASQTSQGARITRAEAKLVLYKEFELALGRGKSFVTDPDTLVWVVAYEGSGLSCGRGGRTGPPPDCHFAFTVQPARPPDQVGVFGSSATWPDWFDRLPDRGP